MYLNCFSMVYYLIYIDQVLHIIVQSQLIEELVCDQSAYHLYHVVSPLL